MSALARDGCGHVRTRVSHMCLAGTGVFAVACDRQGHMGRVLLGSFSRKHSLPIGGGRALQNASHASLVRGTRDASATYAWTHLMWSRLNASHDVAIAVRCAGLEQTEAEA
jgi:hypothetical protein